MQVGMHHSRLASSLISLLNVVVDGNRRAQELVREAGGLGLLCRALDLLVQPGVSDILQLRVAICAALQRSVQVRAERGRRRACAPSARRSLHAQCCEPSPCSFRAPLGAAAPLSVNGQG
jgi:hypothetical protein